MTWMIYFACATGGFALGWCLCAGFTHGALDYMQKTINETKERIHATEDRRG